MTSVDLCESISVPVDVGVAWGWLPRSDLTEVSQPWGPIPGVVAVRDEPERFFDEPGHRRVLENSDGSTMVESVMAIEPNRSFDYTITELSNGFRFLTPGARARFEFESVGDRGTRITWRYSWTAHHPLLLPLVWLVAHLAFRPYMRRMLDRIGKSVAAQVPDA